eukprot:1267960-Pyramimonas_sp.AAC.1
MQEAAGARVVDALLPDERVAQPPGELGLESDNGGSAPRGGRMCCELGENVQRGPSSDAGGRGRA